MESCGEIRGGVLAVLVIYESDFMEAMAWDVLVGWLREDASKSIHLRQILIYDNSKLPNKNAFEEVKGLTYVHDPTNGGTAAAYTHAVSLALFHGTEWLLLLDQDTALPTTYLNSLNNALLSQTVERSPPEILVPLVRHGVRLISPGVLTRWGSINPMCVPKCTDDQSFFTAIASGTFLKAELLGSIIPFPSGLWLDYVDHWIFSEVRRHGSIVGILDVTLAHDLSIKTPLSLSTVRLNSILDGELILYRKLGVLARIVFPLRLLKRVIYYSIVNPALVSEVISWIFRRFNWKR